MNGFDPSALSKFNGRATEIMLDAIVFDESWSKYSWQGGITYKGKLQYMNVNPILQTYSCGMSLTGGTSFTAKEIEVFPIGFKESLCLDDLADYDIVGEFSVGSGNMNKVIADSLITRHSMVLAKKQGIMNWLGDLTNPGDKLDGWMTQALADTDVNHVTGGAHTEANIDDHINELVEELPFAVRESRENIEVHVSPEDFQLYVNGRADGNKYWDNPQTFIKSNSIPLFKYPNINLVKEIHLLGTHNMLITWNKNLRLVTADRANIGHAKYNFVPVSEDTNDTIYIHGGWRLGMSYVFGEEIATYEVV